MINKFNTSGAGASGSTSGNGSSNSNTLILLLVVGALGYLIYTNFIRKEDKKEENKPTENQ
jgi:hypothetical protein